MTDPETGLYNPSKRDLAGRPADTPNFVVTSTIVVLQEMLKMAEPGAHFDSRGMGLRAQKKLLGKMSSKKIAMSFIDETSGQLLDTFHKVFRQYKDSKKEADKLLKYIIKSVVKVGILHKNDQFNREELGFIDQFKQKFHILSMTLVSFHEVDFTYDKLYLRKSLEECRELLQAIIKRHLTQKSKDRVNLVFDTVCEADFMDALFLGDSYKQFMDKIVEDLSKLMETGVL